MLKFIFVIISLVFSVVHAAPMNIPVLMYHQITDSLPPGITVISTSGFEAEIAELKKDGYTTITISQLADAMVGKIVLSNKTIAITFDDGWRDQLLASQILQQNNMAATFYIITGFFNNPSYVSKEDVAKLAQNTRFEIGAHTVTHFEEYADQMDKLDLRTMVGEIVMSKVVLEQITHNSVHSLAWPYGYYTPDSLNFAGMVGFTSTVIVDGTRGNGPDISTMMIKRMVADGRCDLDQFKQMISTAKSVPCQ